MKTVAFIIGLIAFSAFADGPKASEEIIIKRNNIRVEYHRSHGMVNDLYVSYWSNGKKKAQGYMHNNLRQGQWNLWDSTGKLIMTRNYVNGYHWTLEFPKTGFPQMDSFADTASTIWEVNWKSDSITTGVRQWRYAPFDAQNPMFTRHEFLDTLLSLALNRNMSAAKDDEMRELYMRSELARRLYRCDTSRLLGFRVKQDWFLDYTNQTAVYGIVSLCPVLKEKDGNDSLDFCWFGMKDISNLLFMLEIKHSNTKDFPQRLQDQLTFQAFASKVYKISNRRNVDLDEMYSGEELDQEIQSWEWQPLEWEHDMWLRYYSRK